MKTTFYILALFSINFLCAQKIMEKSIVNSNTSFIQINTDNCFEVVMETSNSNELIAEAVIEGEYQKDLVLNVKEEGATIWVSAGFQPNFVNPNDKLSAHKVVSIALKVLIPANQNVNLYGTSSNIKVSGAYKKLDITLNDGSCALEKISETVNVTTQSGDIELHSQAAKIDALSKYGTINKDIVPLGDHHFVLRTTTGNITIKKIE